MADKRKMPALMIGIVDDAVKKASKAHSSDFDEGDNMDEPMESSEDDEKQLLGEDLLNALSEKNPLAIVDALHNIIMWCEDKELQEEPPEEEQPEQKHIY